MASRNYTEYETTATRARYPSDVSDAEWAIIEPLVTEKAKTSRPSPSYNAPPSRSLLFQILPRCSRRSFPRLRQVCHRLCAAGHP